MESPLKKGTHDQSSRKSKKIQKTVVTETIVRTPHKHNKDCTYEYEEDNWERSPKTDYTYSYSHSYHPHTVPKDASYISPNMARRRLHSYDLMGHSTPISQHTTISTTTSSSASSRLQDIGEDDISFPNSQADSLYLPPSITRSGRMYEPGFEITGSVRGRRRMPRRTTGAHVSSSHSINHLYGLDQESEDDEEVTQYMRTPEKKVELSIWWTIVQTVTSIFTTTTTDTNQTTVIENADSKNGFLYILESPFRFLYRLISTFIGYIIGIVVRSDNTDGGHAVSKETSYDVSEETALEISEQTAWIKTKNFVARNVSSALSTAYFFTSSTLLYLYSHTIGSIVSAISSSPNTDQELPQGKRRKSTRSTTKVTEILSTTTTTTVEATSMWATFVQASQFYMKSITASTIFAIYYPFRLIESAWSRLYVETDRVHDESLVVNWWHTLSSYFSYILLWLFKILASPAVFLWVIVTYALAKLQSDTLGTSRTVAHEEESETGLLAGSGRYALYGLRSGFELLFMILGAPFIFLYQAALWMRHGFIALTQTVLSYFSSAASLAQMQGFPPTHLLQAGGSGAHRLAAESVGTDVWLLKRSSRVRRKRGLCCLLPFILLIPLLLTGLYIARYHKLLGLPILIASDESVATMIPPQAIGGCCDRDIRLEARSIFVQLMAEQEKKQVDTAAAAALAAMATESEKQRLEREAAAARKGEEDESRWQLMQQKHQEDLKLYVNNIVSDLMKEQGNQYAAAADMDTAALAAHTREIEAKVLALVTEKLEGQASSGGEALAAAMLPHMEAQQEQAATLAQFQAQLSAIAAKADSLESQILATKVELSREGQSHANASSIGLVALEDQLAAMRGDIAGLKAAHGSLDMRAKDCCKNDSVIAALVKAGVKEELDALAAAGVILGGSTDDGGGGGAGLAGAGMGQGCQCDGAAGMAGGVTGAGLSTDNVRSLIKDALILYGADKTGRVDFALESAGGSVISIRCSETYHRRTAEFSIFGIPLWYSSNSPRTVIQPEVLPGQCWAFKGSTGFLVIQLAGVIRPDSFSLEHISKSLSPTGKIDSAPRGFSVYGLTHDKDIDGVMLGNYTYREDGDPIQHFLVEEPNPPAFHLVELRILSNHGNPEYTCLYRFRVHGKLKNW